jgi:uncharacterized protein YcgI (DUF1989 family)
MIQRTSIWGRSTSVTTEGLGKILEQDLPPKSGLAVLVEKGQRLRLIDVEGKQVVDMAVFNADNPREKLSTSYSRTRQPPRSAGDYFARDRLTVDDVLLSTAGRRMLRIVAETQPVKGMHDTHHRMCNRTLYDLHGIGPKDGCLEILTGVLAAYGIGSEDIPDTFDIHMHYRHDVVNGRWHIEEPLSRPGDYIEFEAEMDCLVGLSNCPEDSLTMCNAKHCTPYRVEVYAVAP